MNASRRGVVDNESAYRYLIAGLVLTTHFALGLNLFAVSPVLPLVIDEYGISRTTGSLLVAGPVLVQAAVGLPGSIVITRIGLRRTFSIGSSMVGLLSMTALLDGFVPILLLRLVSGLGAALLIASTGPLIMQWFRPREVPVVNTLFLVALSGGISVGVLSAAPISDMIGWRNVLGAFGAVSLLASVLWVCLGRARSAPAAGSMRSHIALARSVLLDRTVLLLVVADALVFAQYAVLTGWLPTFFHERRGMSLDRAGYLTGLLPTVGIAAVIVGGVSAARMRRWRLHFIVPGIMVGLGGLGSFLLTDTLAIAFAIIILGIGTWIYQPTFHTVPMQLPWMTADKVAIVWGASMTIAGFGQFVAPIVVGASRDLLGSFVPGFLVWSALSWSLVIAGFRMPDRARSTPALPTSINQRRFGAYTQGD